MNDAYTLTWKRDSWSGCYRTTTSAPGSPVYTVWRDDRAATGRQWSLSVVTAGNQVTQTRTGFDKKFTAQEAALNTRCHVCGRFFPFAMVERSGSDDGWRCRDHEGCAAVKTERDAEERRVYTEIRDTDMEDIGVTDREDGPELNFIRAGTGNRITVECTETDLLRLFRVLARRMRDRAMTDVEVMIRQCDELLSARDDQEAPGAG